MNQLVNKHSVPTYQHFAQLIIITFSILSLSCTLTTAIQTEIGFKFIRAPESRVVPPGDRDQSLNNEFAVVRLCR